MLLTVDPKIIGAALVIRTTLSTRTSWCPDDGNGEKIAAHNSESRILEELLDGL